MARSRLWHLYRSDDGHVHMLWSSLQMWPRPFVRANVLSSAGEHWPNALCFAPPRLLPRFVCNH
jgi:hypothetical protein